MLYVNKTGPDYLYARSDWSKPRQYMLTGDASNVKLSLWADAIMDGWIDGWMDRWLDD